MVIDKTVKCEREGGRERERKACLWEMKAERKEAFKCVSPRCLFTALLLETVSFKAL